MTRSSKKHHQVPKWLLKNFSIGGSKRVWVGLSSSGDVMKQHIKEVFTRNNANTRTDYIPDGNGGFRAVKSDDDERLLAEFDGRMQKATKQILQWARQHRRTGQAPPLPPQEVVNHVKALIVTQARRTHEYQDRVGFLEGFEDAWLDIAYESAEADGVKLGPREKLTRNPELQALVSVSKQNLRANFASGDHPILKDKEKEYLSTTGLGVGIAVSSDPGLVIGSQGITIVRESDGEVAYLPLSPDVVVCLTPRPHSLTFWNCDANFVERHNKAARMMSAGIAGNSKQAIEDLL